jgi:S1-C subfamily serine protease
MSLRVYYAILLSIIAGLLAGFGVANFPVDEARAMPADLTLTSAPVDTPAALTTTIEKLPPAENIGPGGSFVTDVYQRISPAVVHITNRGIYERFDFFFGRQQYETESTGSGVIVDTDGYILTNFHVISGAKELLVVLNDGREFAAEVVGSDPGTDLALLKVESSDPLPAAPLGDSAEISVGEWVVAIGNPRGLDWTVTVGVISALGRETISQTGQTMRGLIQTDASINPGNSGGPLMNARGEVIGINEMIVSGSGGSEGIGLAIPINTAKVVLDDLITHGRVLRSWLGVELHDVTPQMVQRMNLPVDYGALIVEVYEDSPAANAGLVPAMFNRKTQTLTLDIITAFDGQRITGEQDLLDAVRESEPGDTVELDVYRVSRGGYEAQRIIVTLEALPKSAPLMGIV